MRNLALLLVAWIALLAWLAPAQGQGLAAGDLVVSDLANARVLRVRPNGAVSVLSPRAGSGTNFLDAPTGIVVAPDRTVYVVDNDLDALIEIDPATGAQSEIPLFRIVEGEFVESSTGQEPWGLALDDFGVLWVSASASNIVRRIGIETGVVETVITAGDLGTGGGPYGLWVKHDELATELIVANADAGTYVFEPGNEEILPPFDPSASVWDVDLIEDQLNLLLTLQRTPGSGAFSCGEDSGLYGTVLGSDAPLATGGLIRCPYAMVLSDTAIYIAEAASTIGGGARVIRVNRTSYADSVLANLPDGVSDTIPAGIAYVAAPEAASGVTALLAIACLWTLRRQAASRPIQLRS